MRWLIFLAAWPRRSGHLYTQYTSEIVSGIVEMFAFRSRWERTTRISCLREAEKSANIIDFHNATWIKANAAYKEPCAKTLRKRNLFQGKVDGESHNALRFVTAVLGHNKTIGTKSKQDDRFNSITYIVLRSNKSLLNQLNFYNSFKYFRFSIKQKNLPISLLYMYHLPRENVRDFVNGVPWTKIVAVCCHQRHRPKSFDDRVTEPIQQSPFNEGVVLEPPTCLRRCLKKKDTVHLISFPTGRFIK